MKYTISITKEEYEFIITAVDAYVASLRGKMADQANTWLIRSQGQKVIAVTKDAPWGLKKDGTPAKKRGRPSKNAKKVKS